MRPPQKKTRAMVAHEDGEEAFKCMNMKRPRSRENSKKSNSNGLTSNDEAVLLAKPRVMMVRSTLK